MMSDYRKQIYKNGDIIEYSFLCKVEDKTDLQIPGEPISQENLNKIIALLKSSNIMEFRTNLQLFDKT